MPSFFHHHTRHLISSITYTYLLLFSHHITTSSFLFLLLLLPTTITITTANNNNDDDKTTLSTLAEEISQTVLTFASQMEESHSKRCDYNLSETCHGSHYSLCRSRFPHATCIGGDDVIIVVNSTTNDTTAIITTNDDNNETEMVIFNDDYDDDGYNDTTTTTTTTTTTITAESSPTPTIAAASSAALISSVCTTTNNTSCGGIIDTTITGLHLSPTTSTTSSSSFSLMESICATPTTTTNTSLSSSPPSLVAQSYYATTTGLFSLLPSRPYCSPTYDPHHRPWYVAAATGPKDVLFILDASGSMSSYDRWTTTVNAVVDVLKMTTTGSDYVGVIIAYGDDDDGGGVVVLTGEYMVQMTTEGRERVIESLMTVTPEGAGGDDDMTEGVLMALDVWDASVAAERNSGCRAVALVTVTDGVIGENETSWREVRERLNRTSTSTASSSLPPVLFVYGLGYESYATRSQSRAALCSIRNAVWNYIPEGGDISRVMMDYYTVFLTVGSNDDDDDGSSFTAWVDPYEFASSGVMGTTIAAPVYDRTNMPSVLIGVVGIDVTMDVLNDITTTTTTTGGSSEMTTLDQLVMRSRRPTCPPLNNIASCHIMQRWREDVCPGQCPDYNETHEGEESVVYDPWLCPNRNESEYDINPWNNTDYDDDDDDEQAPLFVERACCQSLTTIVNNDSLFTHDGSNLSSSTTYSYQQCAALINNDESTTPPSSTSSNMFSTYGAIIFIVILVILVGIICGLRRRRLQKQHQEQIEHHNQQVITSPTSTTQAVITGYAVTEEEQQQQKLPYYSSSQQQQQQQQPYQPQYPPPALNIPEERLANYDGNNDVTNGTPGSAASTLPYVYTSAMATQAANNDDNNNNNNNNNNDSMMSIGYTQSYDEHLNLPPAIADHMIAAPPTPQHSYRDLQ